MSKRAFSVIEFVVIIAMLGLVIAVGAPAFLRHQAITHARTCQENLSRIEAALEAYRLDHSLTQVADTNVDDLVDTTGTGRLAQLPQCPARGTYHITKGKATCSVGDNKANTFAPHIYSTELPYVAEAKQNAK